MMNNSSTIHSSSSSSEITSCCKNTLESDSTSHCECKSLPQNDSTVIPPSSSSSSFSSSSSSSVVAFKSSTSETLPNKNTLKSIQQTIPDDILNDKELNQWIQQLPKNYNFEIPKTIHRIRESKAKTVALQFPEGLLMFSCAISDILKKFCQPHLQNTIIMGDVTYGACCIDDFTASALGADFMVHYAHSCLNIQFDLEHMIKTIKANFKQELKVAMVSTIQFVSSLRAAKQELETYFADLMIPQVKPLSPGEVLGCTAPQLKGRDILIYIGDGRFHLESSMIQNPDIPAYQYDPYSKVLTQEKYDHRQMKEIRKDAIDQAKKAGKFGIILGTLGRQGSPKILDRLEKLLKQKGIAFITVLLSEIFPSKLSLFQDIDAWIQIACPRLSVDWGYAFDKPLLTPYEAEVALENTQWREVYPMDFYSAGGESWTVKYGEESAKPKVSKNDAARKQMLKERLRNKMGKKIIKN